MDRPIQVGDLVIVIRDHCSDAVVGRVGVVKEIVKDEGRCKRCGAVWVSVDARLDNTNNWYELSWLKRIDPLSEPEHVTTDDEVTL